MVVALKWPTLHDPHYWDALGCYVPQARFFAEHGFDWQVYQTLSYVRPPFLTVLLGLLMRVTAGSREALHLAIYLFTSLLLCATYAIARALRASSGTAVLAALLCFAAPPVFAQAGLVQSDLPAAALAATAWALLLHRRTGWFVVVASLAVLTKESGYAICPPAALLLYLRAGRPPLVSLRAIRAALPAGIPCLVLALWLVLHQKLTGAAMLDDHKSAIGPSALITALNHNLLDSGRFVLWGLAALAIRHAAREPAWPSRTEVLLTALAAASLPLFFPAWLPRYMLSSLPMLAALAALGAASLPRNSAVGAAALSLMLLVFGWRGALTKADNAHLEVSTRYRELLLVHKQTAEQVAALTKKRVLGGFPTFFLLTAPAEDGYLMRPAPIWVPSKGMTLAQLCENDYLVEAQDPSVREAITTLAQAGALELVKERLPPGSPRPTRAPGAPLNHEVDRAVRIYRLRCPTVDTPR